MKTFLMFGLFIICSFDTKAMLIHITKLSTLKNHPLWVVKSLVGVHGLEPRYTESESAVLPLNYTPIQPYIIYAIFVFSIINLHQGLFCPMIIFTKTKGKI